MNKKSFTLLILFTLWIQFKFEVQRSISKIIYQLFNRNSQFTFLTILLISFCVNLCLSVVTICFSAVPVMSGGTKQIRTSVSGSAGGKVSSGSGKTQYFTVSEPGGVLEGTATGKTLRSGYWGQGWPPAAVTDLTGFTGLTEGTVILSWSVPGDELGATNLPAGSMYKVQYSTESQTVVWTPANTQVEISTSGVSPGLTVSTVVTGLTSGGTYYFRIWTLDESSNYSTLSNGATSWAEYLVLGVLVEGTTSYDFGTLSLNQSTVTPSGFTIKNTGNTNETFGIRCSTVTVNSPWQPNDTPAMDKFVLKSAFHPSKPVVGQFGPEDIVYSTNTYSTGGSVYTVDGTQTGYNVSPSNTRTVWHLLTMPLDVSTTEQQKIRVYFTGQQAP